jgi:phage terminase large subunit-like protein
VRRTVPDEYTGGPRFASFCSHYLRHTKGRWAGHPLDLEDWERAFWWEALELDPVTGLRVYQEVGMGLPRKNGKSTQASALGLYGLVADQEAEPEVYVGAAAQQQAGIVLRQSLSMARRSPRLQPYVKVQKYLIEGVRNGGVMRALSSDGALQHGLNPSLSIIDEVHAHKDSSLWTALTTGTGAREQPLTFWITTSGVDEEGLLHDLYGQMWGGPGTLEQVTPYLTVYRDRENGVLIHWYGAPQDADPEDPRVWTGCNPASWRTEDALRKDYGRLVQKGLLMEWRIYHLNQILGAESAWLPDKAWAAIQEGSPGEDPWHGLDESLPVGVGIEKAPQSEGAAIVAAQRQGERILVRARHFQAESLTGRVSVVDMRQTLRDLRSRFPQPMVRDPKTKRGIPGPAFAFDPYAFTESAESLEQEGLNMVTMGQTAATMAPASTTTYELVTTGRLTHDGDPILARHVMDSSALLTERGMKVQKGKRRPNHSAIAMVMAVALASVEPPKPFVRKPRVARGF